MPQTDVIGPEAAILGRLNGLERATLTPAAAEAILAIRLSAADQDRANALAAKSRAGSLTKREQAEVEAYSRIGSILGILKSRVRQSLRGRRGGNGQTE